MRTGAVVMIDALGFKGIWDGADPSVILRKMGALKQAAESDIKGVKLGHVRGAKVAFLSDTIVIGVASGQPVGRGPGPNKRGNVRAIMQAAFQTASVLAAALEEAPRLAYRGCLTFGEFEIDGPFVLGPAIDEAATHYECADGAFVWLTPKAKAIAGRVLRGPVEGRCELRDLDGDAVWMARRCRGSPRCSRAALGHVRSRPEDEGSYGRRGKAPEHASLP